MAKLILKIPYIKAGPKAGGWFGYIATRKGVDKTINHKVTIQKPTKKQIECIDEMIKNYPDAKNSYEYQDYMENPTRQNASALITIAAESNPEVFENRENYLNYIATRPKVEKKGEHGLFGNEDNINLQGVKDEISPHSGIMWLPIISLKREDAYRLGYDNAESWRELLRSKQMDIAELFGIPDKDFTWYAAFHNEGHHPHCHMVVYSKNNKRGYLTKYDIEKMKSMLVNEIFKNEMYELYSEKTVQRERISDESKQKLKELTDKISSKDYSDSPICDMLTDLSKKLKTVKGKKTYGYLPKPVKKDVDKIIKAMSQDKDIQAMYNEWCDIQKKIVRYYNDKEVEHPPLWENKEFKKIKNAVIKEAEKFQDDRHIFLPKSQNAKENILEDEEIEDDNTANNQDTNRDINSDDTESRNVIADSALKLFCRLASVIESDSNQKTDGHNKTIVDSKVRNEILKKKQRLGIKMR